MPDPFAAAAGRAPLSHRRPGAAARRRRRSSSSAASITRSRSAASASSRARSRRRCCASGGARRAVVVREDGPGRPAPGRLRRARSRIAARPRGGALAEASASPSGRTSTTDIYREVANRPRTPDVQYFAGWNSSYTGVPLPDAAMRRVGEADRRRGSSPLQPRRVLEIGCGTGCCCSRIAPHCERYWPRISRPTALAQCARRSSTAALRPHVELLPAAADDFERDLGRRVRHWSSELDRSSTSPGSIICVRVLRGGGAGRWRRAAPVRGRRAQPAACSRRSTPRCRRYQAAPTLPIGRAAASGCGSTSSSEQELSPGPGVLLRPARRAARRSWRAGRARSAGATRNEMTGFATTPSAT